MLRDVVGQAWEAMLYNRRRTAITMIGMAWGIATVVLLLAYGAGFTRAIEAIFAQWGTNIIGTFPGRTSEQAGGEKSGAKVRFTIDDVDRLSAAVPGINHISPIAFKDVVVQNDLHSYTWTVNGVRAVFQDIWKLDTDSGRFFNGQEEQQRAHVCVIGSEAKTKLFSGGWAIGETIRLKIKKKVIAGSKGGRPGQWSARKAQLVTNEYKAEGGGFKHARNAAQKSLKSWGDEKWHTSDGKKATRGKTTHRYLPDKAWKELSPTERKATDRKKVAASRRGKQFVKNTPAAAKARKRASKRTR